MMDSYQVFKDGEYKQFGLLELVRKIRAEDSRPIIWSARLSTGLFGLTNCKSGNRGPKGYHEILLAVGDDGLRKLVDLGFLTCPTCLPEKVTGFEDIVRKQVRQKYALTSIDDFTNKDILSYDVRRVRWEEVVPEIKGVPNRLYVPSDLCEEDLLDFKKRFDKIGLGLPPVGYYNPDVPKMFTEYEI